MPRRSGRFGRHRCLHHQAARAGIDDTETAQRDQRQRLHGFLGAGRIVADIRRERADETFEQCAHHRWRGQRRIRLRQMGAVDRGTDARLDLGGEFFPVAEPYRLDLGIDRLRDHRPSELAAAQRPREHGPEFGHFGAVSHHAFGARRHMFDYGTTREDFGHVAMAFREHATRNPEAQMRKPMTLDDYMKARLIVDPFGLFDCSLNSDGAGAVVITSVERAKDLRMKPVLIKGFGTHNNTKGFIQEDHMLVTGAKKSGERAYTMAGLGPKDVSTAQIYDCFTYMAMTQIEDYGFCKKGEEIGRAHV